MSRALDALMRDVVACERCPRLREYCRGVAETKRRAYLDWEYWGRPVPSFGDPNARVLLIGLAPGAHGANRTGRMFTGDSSGDFLYRALYETGFASQPESRSRDDGLKLSGVYITAAARCAPPGNKPTPQELRNCFPYLVEEFAALPRLRVAIGLGAIGFAAVVRALRERGYELDPAKPTFAHGAEVCATRGRSRIIAIASYHPSRQNTNTGVLTVPMFDAIFTRARAICAADGAEAPPPTGFG